MKYLALYCGGQEDDKDLFNQVREIIKVNADRVPFDSKEECLAMAERIKGQLPMGYNLHCDWLNGWDNPIQESVVFSVARSSTMSYAVAYLHFYKVRTKPQDL